MKNYIVAFEPASDKDCDCKSAVIRNIESYKYSTKLCDNVYQISSFQDLATMLKNVSVGANDDDKVIIIPFEVIIGKNIPNI